MILMIDNFDSFTYNLVQGFESMGEEVGGIPERCDRHRMPSKRCPLRDHHLAGAGLAEISRDIASR